MHAAPCRQANQRDPDVASRRPPLELWGGIECTVNRVGDRYRDQVRLTGHHDRVGDLDLFAGLGLQAIRYPVLWERTAPDPSGEPDWRWPDERLARLRALDIRPIVGLVHHGSGPRHTHLLDDGFAPGLGRYGAAVAERYPWIEAWTPVNEPLTTARFAALYGHWYPHAADEAWFWRALLNQVDATRAAMRAIRRVNPAARLVQTDDLGRTNATEPLSDQADHDNLRRWAGWDLLFGRVDRYHPLFATIERASLGDRARRIADDPCPPDIVGINHYLTSDRFLDHRLDRYPAHLHGGNGRSAYADTEAVRVLDPPPAGVAGALREAWDRYEVPLALTEVHNGCTREEQLRWAAQAWDAAVAARQDGVDVRAVTAWSLLGGQGWNTLLTADGAYEAGVFDVSSGTPRPTALAALWRGLPHAAARHPVAAEPGWWQRLERLLYGDAGASAPPPRADALPLLIVGAQGRLGRAFARACAARGIRHELLESGLFDPDGLDDIVAAIRPWAVVDAAGGIGVDATTLAEACAAAGIGCLTIASDLGGGRGGGRDLPAPLGECAHPPGWLIVATLPPSLVGTALDLLIDGEAGLWHVANGMAPTRAEPAPLTAAASTPFAVPSHPVPRPNPVPVARVA